MGTGWNILIAVLAGVGIVSFVFLGFLIIRSAYASSRKKSKNGSAGKKKRETMKMVVWVCLANGFAWVWCSYSCCIYWCTPPLAAGQLLSSGKRRRDTIRRSSEPALPHTD